MPPGVSFIGGPERLDDVLRQSDYLAVTLSLSPDVNDPAYRERRNHIAARAVAWTPGDPIPRIEYTDADLRRHVDIAFEIAKRYDVDISMLVDDAGDLGGGGDDGGGPAGGEGPGGTGHYAARGRARHSIVA